MRNRKSQLAIEYSYRVREQQPDTWVFWVFAGSSARFEESYRLVAERVKITGWDRPDVDILKLVDSWLRDEANGRWLMIVDNADDASVLNFRPHSSKDNDDSNSSRVPDASHALSDFLPQSEHEAILVTSRSRDVAFSITGNVRDIIMVNPMQEEDAMNLLRVKLDIFDDSDARKLVQVLDYMPLAISQATSFISQRFPPISVSRYLQDLQKNESATSTLLKRNLSDNRRDGKASNSILATWQISFENIQREKPSAAELLSLMCLFDRQRISESLLKKHYQRSGKKDDFEDDIHVLCSYSLVGINVDGQFEMHRLVQFSTKSWLELRNELEIWKEKVIEVIYDVFPT
jgi:hypothetical protein